MDSTKGMKILSGASVIMALLQSVCTAVLTINGIRAAIGLAALAASTLAPLHRFHSDAIRIPMLTIAVVGAILNLVVLAWIRHLRARPAAQWRRRELTPRELRSERLQVAMAILTLVLVGLEVWGHATVHHAQVHAAAQSNR